MDCPLRTEAEKKQLQAMKKKERTEIDPDDMEEADNAPFEEDEDDKDSETASMAPQMVRDCIIEVFPHAAPKRFWNLILESLNVGQCQCIINLTTTAHPSLLLSATRLCIIIDTSPLMFSSFMGPGFL